LSDPHHAIGPRLSTRLVRPFLDLLREGGASFEGALVGAESAIDDPEARIPHSAAMEMLDVLVRGMRDRSIGLKAAQRVVPSNFDVLEYAGLSSGTVREAIETTNRYVRLMHDAADFFLEEREGVARWVLRMSQGVVLTAPAVDFVAGVLADVAPRLVGRAIDFRRINFRHSPPVDTTSYEEHSCCQSSTIRWCITRSAP
jgi:hypothetical protein